jgi:YD repeat-containing protein
MKRWAEWVILVILVGFVVFEVAGGCISVYYKKLFNARDTRCDVRIFSLGITLGIGILIYSDSVIADQARPDLGTIFNGNYQQTIDPFGTVSRAAYDASGRLVGVQVGIYRPGAPNGMVLEMTYLEPDAEHPRGQAFDGAGNPMPLH